MQPRNGSLEQEENGWMHETMIKERKEAKSQGRAMEKATKSRDDDDSIGCNLKRPLGAVSEGRGRGEA